MGIKVGPLYYGHVAGREYNVGDIVSLNEHKKSTTGTDVVMREMWVCVKRHVSSSDAMEKGCWALIREKELEVDENDFIL